MATKKIYAVKNGRSPGIYHSWDECRKQVHGYPDAAFKSFTSAEQAEAYLQGETAAQSQNTDNAGYHVFVDGSFRKAADQYSWAFVVYDGDKVRYANSGVGDSAEAAAIHNVAGELAAVMRAVKWADENNVKPLIINHDYSGIAAWATGEWKAKNKFTQAYVKYMSPYMNWVSFNKVRGHTGVEGNELADKLAKEALTKANEGI